MRAIGFALGLIVGAGLTGCGVSDAQADRSLADQAQVAGKAVMDSLSSEMREPAATKWGAVWENGGRICGTFNPKNSAGDYVGVLKFVGRKGGIVLVDGVSSPDDFRAEWGHYCNHAHHLVQAGDPPGPAIHAMDKAERAAEQAVFAAPPLKLDKNAPESKT
jgi:hypothetical protein